MANIYVLPVSGGYFPHQLAVLEWFGRIKQKPDLVLGSSGGNVAAYISLAAGWTPEGIYDILNYMSSNLFISSWWPDYLFYMPSIIRGIFHGSMYNINTNFYDFFEKIFSNKNIQDTEIWTGVYNRTLSKTTLFTNMSERNATINNESDNSLELLNVQPLVYGNGDINIISKASLASASVPVIFPPVEIIPNQFFTDGGNSFSSPLTPLKESITKAYKYKDLHITYITPYNYINDSLQEQYIDKEIIPNVQKDTKGSMFSYGTYAITEMIKSLTYQDRLSGITLINPSIDELNYEESIINFEEFVILMERIKIYKRTFLEIYPLSNTHINITKFTPNDIIKIIEDTNQLGMRLWFK